MTKLRSPHSEHDAVRTAIGVLGLAEAARHAGRHPRTVGSWSEAERAARSGGMPFRAAILLDRACIAAGAPVPPIGSFYMAELRATCTASYYAAHARAELAARAAIEGAEATAACLRAYAGPTERRALLQAERETQESIAASGALLFDIRRQLAGLGVERSW